MKTLAEVEALKREWAADPIWDIEDTEGFEEYRDELLTFRQQKEKEWEEERRKEIIEYAKKIGLEDNLKLAKYIWWLEWKIQELETKNKGDNQ